MCVYVRGTLTLTTHALQIALEDPDKPTFHLCIVNLVIGTLYCAKGNYEFGISRIMKSLEPYDKKLGTDTWFYAKRCFLGLAESLAKHMVFLKVSFARHPTSSPLPLT